MAADTSERYRHRCRRERTQYGRHLKLQESNVYNLKPKFHARTHVDGTIDVRALRGSEKQQTREKKITRNNNMITYLWKIYERTQDNYCINWVCTVNDFGCGRSIVPRLLSDGARVASARRRGSPTAARMTYTHNRSEPR